MADKPSYEVNLPEGRMINGALFERDVYKDTATGKEGEARYQIELAFNPDDVTGEGSVEDMIINCVCDKWGDEAEDWYFEGKIYGPFLNGDNIAAKREKAGKKGDAYKGKEVLRAHTFFNVDGDRGPGGIAVVGLDCEDIVPANKSEVFRGMYAEAIVEFAAYEQGTTKGVTAYLKAVQKTKPTNDDDRLTSPRDFGGAFTKKAGGGEAGENGGRRRRRSR